MKDIWLNIKQYLSSISINGPVLFLIAAIAIFYFFIINPRLTEEERQHQFHKKMKIGDPVVTIGGIHGVILYINKESIIVEVDKRGCQLEVSKEAIFPPPISSESK